MRFLDASEVEALAQAVPERDRALVYVLAVAGLRVGEAAALLCVGLRRAPGTPDAGEGSINDA
jgi:site-specific recombinase XerD